MAPILLIRSLFSADVTFSWFASLYSSFLIFLAHLFGKKAILILGGVDVAKEKDLHYGICRRSRRWAAGSAALEVIERHIVARRWRSAIVASCSGSTAARARAGPAGARAPGRPGGRSRGGARAGGVGRGEQQRLEVGMLQELHGAGSSARGPRRARPTTQRPRRRLHRVGRSHHRQGGTVGARTGREAIAKTLGGNADGARRGPDRRGPAASSSTMRRRRRRYGVAGGMTQSLSWRRARTRPSRRG